MNIEEKIKQYYQLEKDILEELDNKVSSGDECNYDNRIVFKTISEDGEWDEIRTVCISCGGFKTRVEE